MDSVAAILAAMIETEVPGSDGELWQVECDGVLVGTMQSIRISAQT